MALVQYTTVVPGMERKPARVDTTAKTGVYLNEVERVLHGVMDEIRATGKCGMLVIRWDGQAWCIHRCDPPCRVNE